jgi:hypothetical protein
MAVSAAAPLSAHSMPPGPAAVSEPVEKPEARPLARAVEEIATDKVPFGARATQARAPFANPPAARAEESRSVFQDAGPEATARRAPAAGAFGAPQRGRYSDSTPDIDYETPAFLRNQAD